MSGRKKLLFRPYDEVSVIFCGTAGTRNELNVERGRRGEHGEYANISVVVPLETTNLSSLRALEGVQTEDENADFLDAIIVGMDMLIKRINVDQGAQAATKRIVVVSNFATKVKLPSPSFRNSVISNLVAHATTLEVVSIDFCISDEEGKVKAENHQLVSRLLSRGQGTIKHAKNKGELLSIFAVKDVMPIAIYKGPLSLGGDMLAFQVRVFKKVAREKIPSLQSFSDRSRDLDATHVVSREIEYRTLADPDTTVAPEERIKAFKYGKQLVPLSKDEETSLMYDPEKGFQILGFVDADQTPRHRWMKEPYLVIPEFGASRVGVTALCEAMKRQRKTAVVRAKLRANVPMFLGILAPFQEPESNLVCFIMNISPFAEDVRYYPFASFDSQPGRTPTEAQLDAVQKVMDSMDLVSGGEEMLCPDTLANPALQKFYYCIGKKAINPEGSFPEEEEEEEDDIVSDVFDGPLIRMPDAEDNLKNCSQLFELVSTAQDAPASQHVEEEQQQPSRAQEESTVFSIEDAGQEWIQAVGTANPVQNFGILVSRGKIGEAIRGMGEAIKDIVEHSVEARSYPKALDALLALRKGCVENNKASDFNDILRDLYICYKFSSRHSAFGEKMLEGGIMLIHTGEVADSDVSPEEAHEILKMDTGPLVAAEQDVEIVEEEDDFEGME